MSPEIVRAVFEHAAREQPREACGLVVEGTEYLACRNVASAGPHFAIDAEDYAFAEDRGKVTAVCHSHVNEPPSPSMADRVGCERSGLPWLIVNWPLGTWQAIEPSGWHAPYEGREFVHGVLDCYTLVRDWYGREMGVELPDVDRPDEWWLNGQDLYREGFEANGFVRVDGTAPRRGDGFLMHLGRSPVPCHAAIYLGDGRILHHVQGRLSKIEMYGGQWAKRTALHLRHRSVS